MDIRNQVEAALHYAQRPVRGHVPGPIESADGTIYTDLAGLSDDDIVTDMYPDNCDVGPGRVLVDSVPKLAEIYEEISHQTRLSFPREFVESKVRHEAAHGEAMHAIGVTAVYYGVLIDAYKPRTFSTRLSWQPFSFGASTRWPITKLAHAAVIAAPPDPSPGDRRRIREMGYLGVDDVAERVALHNYRASRVGSARISMPASYTGPHS
jgi:hypothetical protein